MVFGLANLVGSHLVLVVVGIVVVAGFFVLLHFARLAAMFFVVRLPVSA